MYIEIMTIVSNSRSMSDLKLLCLLEDYTSSYNEYSWLMSRDMLVINGNMTWYMLLYEYRHRCSVFSAVIKSADIFDLKYISSFMYASLINFFVARLFIWVYDKRYRDALLHMQVRIHASMHACPYTCATRTHDNSTIRVIKNWFLLKKTLKFNSYN